ncbi:MAG: YhbY family RNA-binding protein [Methanocalculus sp. MSAO_Arc2]|nr:MAG: YhbY family RNA-binding protein [Methanocalculus sp. MSAO_Arc2]
MQSLKPTIWVGKCGVTEEVIHEARSQLETRGVIKIKWLKNAEMDPGALAAGTGGVVIDIRGRTMVIAKRRG